MTKFKVVYPKTYERLKNSPLHTMIHFNHLKKTDKVIVTSKTNDSLAQLINQIQGYTYNESSIFKRLK